MSLSVRQAFHEVGWVQRKTGPGRENRAQEPVLTDRGVQRAGAANSDPNRKAGAAAV